MREAEVLICGLKLLLEDAQGRVQPRAATGLDEHGGILGQRSSTFGDESNEDKSNTSSELSSTDNESDNVSTPRDLPEGHQSWSQVPTRNHLRIEASSHSVAAETPRKTSPIAADKSGPRYYHGEQLITEIATRVKIPLPLPLCRVLFLDTTSPLMKRWEIDRGDINYSRTGWNFPPSSPRRQESDLPVNKLLAGGSMQSGHRTVLFDRLRNGQRIRLSETIVVVMDDDEKASISMSERMPRRGFSTKVRITLLKETERTCSVSIFGDIVPIGEDLSNQGAVHRAFLLVVDEMKGRYGTEGLGEIIECVRIVFVIASLF